MERHVFDRMAELDGTHWWFTARRRILATLIERVIRLPKAARILEIGCGTGHNLEMLQRFGTVEASELDQHARSLASKRLGRRIEAAALPDLSVFPAKAYDLVALLDVLEHVRDDAASLAAIRERLKPGGKLLVTVPANKWMWSAHDVAHHHHRRYNKSEFAALARRTGLTVDLISPFNTILFPLVAAARIVGRVTGKAEADDTMPPAALNAVFAALFGLERRLIGRVPLPFGVSLVAVLVRAD